MREYTNGPLREYVPVNKQTGQTPATPDTDDKIASLFAKNRPAIEALFTDNQEPMPAEFAGGLVQVVQEFISERAFLAKLAEAVAEGTMTQEAYDRVVAELNK